MSQTLPNNGECSPGITSSDQQVVNCYSLPRYASSRRIDGSAGTERNDCRPAEGVTHRAGGESREVRRAAPRSFPLKTPDEENASDDQAGLDQIE